MKSQTQQTIVFQYIISKIKPLIDYKSYKITTRNKKTAYCEIQSMIRRFYQQRKQAKCNFCFEWFQSKCQIKHPINLCNVCLQKGLKTSCYKVPSPDGQCMYQLYLFKNNFNIKEGQEMVGDGKNFNNNNSNSSSSRGESQFKHMFIEHIDNLRNQQLKKMSSKWEKITQQIQKLSHFDENQMNKFTERFNNQIQHLQNPQKFLVQTVKQLKIENKTSTSQKKQKKQAQNYNIIKQNICSKIAAKPQKMGTNSYHSPSRPALKQLNSPQNQKNQFSNFVNNYHSQNLYQKQHKQLIKKQKDTQTQSFDIYGVDQEDKLLYMNSKKSLVSKENKTKLPNQNLTAQAKQKRQRDISLISQNALKQRIYNYLQTLSDVPPALFLPMTLQVYDVIQNTSCLNGCIELVNHSLHNIDIRCYLQMLQWTGVDILKLVKVGLTDQNFEQLLVFLKNKRIESLVVTSNKLTQSSIVMMKQMGNTLKNLRSVYFGKNRIRKIKVKDSIKEMQTMYVMYM